MESIRSLYQYGHGPSSSHTMGPAKAAFMISKKYPEATHFSVVLYNSLALTGQGHLTMDAIAISMDYRNVAFETKIDVNKHPNYFIIHVFKSDECIKSHAFMSVGGGKILEEGAMDDVEIIYQESSMKSIKQFIKSRQMSLLDYCVEHEPNHFLEDMKTIWEQMKSSIHAGLSKQGVLPGPLKIKRKAPMLFEMNPENERIDMKNHRLLTAYAFAVSEENASGGLIVTAPTCGACGILPAVLYHTQQNEGFSDTKIAEALAVAGLIGNLIKKNASISGAVAGCQAEVGSACSMAAAAHAYLMGLSTDQIEYAAEVAMEHHLGLTCDPVNGYVQIPCIERNAVAALRAIDASRLASFLTHSRKISFDTVVETMYQTGIDMQNAYKETALGGLAKHYKEEEDANCW